MRVAITTVQIPFVAGGAEFLAKNLKNALNEYGHEAEIISMPFIDMPMHNLENHIIASRLMDVNNSWGGHIDLCIGLKFPAYFMPHENKVIWALHQHRQAYDLFNTEYSLLKNDESGLEAKRIVMNSDNTYLPEAKRIYTIAKNVSNRMMKFNDISSQALYHPCPDMDKLFCEKYDDYILMPSRINITKRQKLALEALSRSKSDIKIYFVGKADNPIVSDEMCRFIKEKGLEKRVKLFDYVSQEEKFRLYANAKAVMFIPLDEDYGYITLEAMAASKMVITCKDSGGPLEFVENGKNGIVCESDADALAQTIDMIAESSGMAEKYGAEAKRHIDSMNITWENVVKELTR